MICSHHYKDFTLLITYEALKDDALYAMVSGNDDKQRLSDIKGSIRIYIYLPRTSYVCLMAMIQVH